MSRFLPRRSLAVTAVGALAVTGLAFSPQPAGAAGPVVLLISQPDRLASVRYDGTDYALQLTAQRLDPSTTVTFEFNRDPRAGKSRGLDGDHRAAHDDRPLRGPVLGAAERPGRADDRPAGGGGHRASVHYVLAAADVVIAGADDLEHSVSIGPGYFPFTTSPEVGLHRHRVLRPALRRHRSHRHHDGGLGHHVRPDRVGRADLVAPVGPDLPRPGRRPPSSRRRSRRPTGAGRPAVPGGFFAGVLNIAPFAPTPATCSRSPPSAAPTTSSPPRCSGRPSGAVNASADAPRCEPARRSRVRSRRRHLGRPQPVAGAEVRRLSDGALVGYTDGLGRVVTRQPGGTSETYYVNTTDADPYPAGTDLASSAVSGRTPTRPRRAASAPVLAGRPASTATSTAAGDLYAPGHRPVRAGRTARATQVRYKLYRDGTTPPGSYRPGAADARGRVVVPLEPLGSAGDHRSTSASPPAREQSRTDRSSSRSVTRGCV